MKNKHKYKQKAFLKYGYNKNIYLNDFYNFFMLVLIKKTQMSIKYWSIIHSHVKNRYFFDWMFIFIILHTLNNHNKQKGLMNLIIIQEFSSKQYSIEIKLQ